MTVWVPVNAEMKGFVGTLIKEASGAAKKGSKAAADEFAKGGKQAGQNLADGLASQAARVEQATAKLTNARKVEAQAAAQVEVAEAALQSLRDSGSATASQLSAAEQKLTTAKNRQADAAQTLARTERDLESVRSGGEGTARSLARAEDALAKAHTDSQTAADQLSTSMLKLEEQKQHAADRSDAVAAAELNLINVRDRYGANTKETARAEKQLESAKKQAATANQQVAKAEGQVKIKRAELESATDTLKAKTKTYEAAQRDAADAASKTGTEVELAGKKFSMANDDIETSSAGLADFAQKAGSAISVLGGAATIGGIASIGMEFSGAMNQVNNELGLTGAAAEMTGESIQSAMRTGVAGSVDQAAEAIGALESQWKYLGSEGEQTAAELSDNFMAFSQTFGVDMAEATQTAGQLITNGLAPDVETAADLMTAAMQRVPAQMREELPEIINEYGTNFRALGFSGEEAFGLLVQQAEKGKWALDKTGDALKEFTIRGSDMSASSVAAYEAIGLSAEDMSSKIAQGGPAARDAMQQVAQGILGIEDPAERANTAIALFGTPLEDLSVDQIPQFLESLSGADGSMADFAGSSQQLADNISGSLQGRLNTVKGTLQSLASDGFMAAWDTASAFIGIIRPLAPILGPMAVAFGALAAGMGAYAAAQKLAAAGGIVKMLRETAAAQFLLNGAMWASPITWIVAGIIAIGAALWAFFTKTETGREMWSNFTDALGRGWDWIVDKLKAGLNWAKETFAPVFTGIKDTAVNAFEGIKDTVSVFLDFWKTGDTGGIAKLLGLDESSWILQTFTLIRNGAMVLKDGLIAAFQWVKDKWGELSIGFGQFYQTWIAPVWSAMQFAGQILGGILSGAFNLVKGAFSILGQIISTVWTTIIQPTFSFLFTGAQNLAAFLAPIFQVLIAGAFQTMGNLFTNVWTTIIQPVWEILKSAAGLVADVLTGNFNNIGNRFSELGSGIWGLVTGIFSTAWNFLKDGVSTAIDVARAAFTGFRDTVSNVAEQVKVKISELPGKIKSVFTGAKDWLVDKGADIINGLWSGLQSAWENARNWLSDLPSKIRNSIGSISFDIGGIFSRNALGSVSHHAAGSNEKHTAQIAPGGAWRIWAEPETGGEAYIPLAPSKRRRSEAILGEVSDRFGLVLIDPTTGQAVNSSYSGDLGPQDVRSFADGGITGGDLVKFVQGQSSRGWQARRPLEGAPYDWGGSNWGDCSGAMSAIAAFANNINPFPRKFATGNEASWLSSHGFLRGRGGNGDLRIGFLNGGPAGGHTAGTLPNGVNVEMGGARGDGQYGGGAAGAWDSYFDTFFYMPMKEKVWNDTKASALGDLTGTTSSGADWDTTTASASTASTYAMATPTATTAAATPQTPYEAAATTWADSMGNRSVAEIGLDAIFGFFGKDASTTKKVLFTPMDELLGVSKSQTSTTSTGSTGNASTSLAAEHAATINDQALTTMTPTELNKDPQLRSLKDPEIVKQPQVPDWGPEFFAYEIARKARDMKLGEKAAKIGVATALVESGNPLKMYANQQVPESLKYRHDAIGSDYDSVGLFQQRDNGAWGTVKQRMTPYDSAGMFFDKLASFDWQSMDPGAAAQKVQVSAFPDRYAQQMDAAARLVSAAGVFDTGGILKRGGVAINLGGPERVLDAKMTPLFDRFITYLPEFMSTIDAARGEARAAWRSKDDGYAATGSLIGDSTALALLNSIESAGAVFDEVTTAYAGGDFGIGEMSRYIGDNAAGAIFDAARTLGSYNTGRHDDYVYDKFGDVGNMRANLNALAASGPAAWLGTGTNLAHSAITGDFTGNPWIEEDSPLTVAALALHDAPRATAASLDNASPNIDASLATLAKNSKEISGGTVVINIDGQEALRQRLGAAEEQIDLHTEDLDQLKKPRRARPNTSTRGGIQ